MEHIDDSSTTEEERINLMIDKVLQRSQHELSSDNAEAAPSIVPMSMSTNEQKIGNNNFFKNIEKSSDDSEPTQNLIEIKCQYCDFKATGNYAHESVDKHVVKVHPEEAANHTCGVCGKNIKHLNTHMLEQHSLESEKNFKCATCDKAFFCWSNYKKHIITHSTTFVHCSNNCGYVTKYINNLKKHESLGTCIDQNLQVAQKSMICNLCGTKTVNMKKHLISKQSRCNRRKLQRKQMSLSKKQKSNLVPKSEDKENIFVYVNVPVEDSLPEHSKQQETVSPKESKTGKRRKLIRSNNNNCIEVSYNSSTIPPHTSTEDCAPDDVEIGVEIVTDVGVGDDDGVVFQHLQSDDQMQFYFENCKEFFEEFNF